MVEKMSPSTMAVTMEPMAVPSDRSDAWSVGKGDWGALAGCPRSWLNETPQLRQIRAHGGLLWPQLGQIVSPLSSVIGPRPTSGVVEEIGGQPSMRRAADGEIARGPMTGCGSSRSGSGARHPPTALHHAKAASP